MVLILVVHIEEFKKVLATEVGKAMSELGNVKAEKQALEQQISDLFALKAKHAPGSSRKNVSPSRLHGGKDVSEGWGADSARRGTGDRYRLKLGLLLRLEWPNLHPEFIIGCCQTHLDNINRRILGLT